MHVYETTHPVAHSAEEMFALVAQVDDYPKFLPLCEALDVKRREVELDGKEVLIATMAVGYGMIHESFTTKVISTRRRDTSWSNISTGRSPSWRTAGGSGRTARGPARSSSISPMRSARACSSGWSAGCSPRRSRVTPAPSRPAPTWSMAARKRRSLHNNDSSSDQRPLDAPPPDLGPAEIPEQHALARDMLSRRPAAK